MSGLVVPKFGLCATEGGCARTRRPKSGREAEGGGEDPFPTRRRPGEGVDGESAFMSGPASLHQLGTKRGWEAEGGRNMKLCLSEGSLGGLKVLAAAKATGAPVELRWLPQEGECQVGGSSPLALETGRLKNLVLFN